MLLLGGDEEKERLDNVEELVSNAVQFETERENPTLSDFLEETSLVADFDNYDESGNAVVLMTVHSAKGLEFPVVFIPGFEENIFPSKTAVDEGDIEEERRLAYVAVTRAKRKLYVISARDRLMFGRIQSNQTSRFVDEMPGGNVVSEEGFGTFTPRRQPEKEKPFASRELSAPSSIISQPKAAVSIIPVGSRVRHAVFGEGTIMSAKPVGADTMYEIAFDNTGTKKLMATFAKLVKI
ncbi:MAG: ATP-binding domain-containing protein [Firmicutes bacterium]|nr:ATP-binding domain-containing protein [Candidatus Colimorpha enterica]